MKVTKWVSYGDAEGLDDHCGGMGGFFDHGMRWKDYVKAFKEEARPYLEALREAIIDKGLRITGSQHQHSPDGVPIFDDGSCGTFSYRAWGDLMAAVWSEVEDKDYCYMDFYM